MSLIHGTPGQVNKCKCFLCKRSRIIKRIIKSKNFGRLVKAMDIMEEQAYVSGAELEQERLLTAHLKGKLDEIAKASN